MIYDTSSLLFSLHLKCHPVVRNKAIQCFSSEEVMLTDSNRIRYYTKHLIHYMNKALYII